VVEVIPSAAKAWLATTAGPGSALHRKHRVYLQVVTIATVPYAYEDRLIRVAPDTFTHLRLFVLDPYDLALSKLTRNLEVDVEDVKHLARVTTFDLAVLQDRYREELRPYVSGPVERSDLTLQLWVDAICEERARRQGGP